MTLMPIDLYEQAAGFGGLAASTAPTVKSAPDGFFSADYVAQAAEIGRRSTWGAAFRQGNTIGSLMSRMDLGVDNEDDGTFDPIAYAKANNLTGYEREFYGVLNERRADAIRAQLQMEQRDRETLDSAGFWGSMVPTLVAGALDVPSLIPGTTAVRGVGGAWSVARSALMGGVSTAAAIGAQELGLHGSQLTRTAGESAVNIGGGAILGSLLGAGTASVLSKNEKISIARAFGNVSDIETGVKPNEFVPPQVAEQKGTGGVGADVAEGAFQVPETGKARTREDMAVAGAAASAVVAATSRLNPVLRSTQRFAASARQIGANLYEDTIYRAMHGAGETAGASVEAAVRTQVTAMQGRALMQAEKAYEEMWAGNAGFAEKWGERYWGRMSRDDFYSQVGVALRNGDEADNPFVARAAQGYRGLFDHFTKQALDLGLLGVEDLDPKTAASYFSRLYKRDVIVAQREQFIDLLTQHFAAKLQEDYGVDSAKLMARRSTLKTRIEDLNLSGPERAARLGDIRQAGEDLDRLFPHHVERASDLSDVNGRVRAAQGADREAAQAERKALIELGGKEFQDYLDQRAELRRRERDLMQSGDAQADRHERAQAAADRLHEQTVGSLEAFARRARNILNKLASDPVAKAEERLAAAEKAARDAADMLARHRARAEKVYAQYLDQMSPQAAYEEAAAKATAAGATAQDAIKAGTKAADEMTVRVKTAQAATTRFDAAEKRLAALSEKLAERNVGPDAAKALVAEIEGVLKNVTEAKADLALRRGEQMARVKERLAKTSPEAAKAQSAAKSGDLDRMIREAEDRFDARWGKRAAKDLETNAAYPFQAAARDTAEQVFGKVTGTAHYTDDLPPFIVQVTKGPLKERTLLIPDEVLAGHGWLENDARAVASYYSRAMGGEVELTRRFGRADMQNIIGTEPPPEGFEHLPNVPREYAELGRRIGEAKSVDEINAILGRKQFGTKADLERTREKAQMLLHDDLLGALTDMKAGRDLIRGTYLRDLNSGNYASIVRSLMHFNYTRQMGGSLLANLSDGYRSAVVHGLAPFVDVVAKRIAGREGVGLALKEAELLGTTLERVTHLLMASTGDIADPFVSKTTSVERFMHKGTQIASRWNLINAATDIAQGTAAVISQHVILDAVLGRAGQAGSFLKDAAEGRRLLSMLGLDKATQADIARLYTTHGEMVDGIRVANTEKWIAEGDAGERAAWAYRTAVNTDVNRIVARRGLGDAPLFANRPEGKLLTQFMGYTLGAHSRVMISGLQESQARFIGGLAAATSFGMLIAYLRAFRSGADQFERWKRETLANPGALIGEGLDISGFFPLVFDLSNRIERVGGAVGYDYRFNPVKTPLSALTGGSGSVTSSRASDSVGAYGALLGPTAGLLESALAAGRVTADRASGKTPPKHDVNQAIAALPFQSYYGMRELLQVLTGNSNYTRH